MTMDPEVVRLESGNLVTVDEDMGLRHLAALLLDQGLELVAVEDREGHLVGVVELADLAAAGCGTGSERAAGNGRGGPISLTSAQLGRLSAWSRASDIMRPAVYAPHRERTE